MIHNRVRIVDVADALGLSTATVSKVIHGNTEKISDETVKRVQQELERTGYIPNMAGILLARNNSRIIGVVVNDRGICIRMGNYRCVHIAHYGRDIQISHIAGYF